jgi:hypothetical protein
LEEAFACWGHATLDESEEDAYSDALFQNTPATDFADLGDRWNRHDSMQDDQFELAISAIAENRRFHL